jgi:hypothetical protein
VNVYILAGGSMDVQVKVAFWVRPALWLLVALHTMLVFGIVASFFILPFYEPWYVALPLCTFIWFFSTSRIECKLTALENELRGRLGMKKIGGFVGHYFFRPFKRKKHDLPMHSG